jgi:hypothetical protein
LPGRSRQTYQPMHSENLCWPIGPARNYFKD